MESEELSHLSVFGWAMLFSCSTNWECFHLQASFHCSINIFTKEVSHHIVSYRIVLYHIVSFQFTVRRHCSLLHAQSNFWVWYSQHYFFWEYVLVYIMVDIILFKNTFLLLLLLTLFSFEFELCRAQPYWFGSWRVWCFRHTCQPCLCRNWHTAGDKMALICKMIYLYIYS